jgi:hypothetical protein
VLTHQVRISGHEIGTTRKKNLKALFKKKKNIVK